MKLFFFPNLDGVIISNGATFLIPVFILCKVLSVGWVNWDTGVLRKEYHSSWGSKIISRGEVFSQWKNFTAENMHSFFIIYINLYCFVGNSTLQFINFWTFIFLHIDVSVSVGCSRNYVWKCKTHWFLTWNFIYWHLCWCMYPYHIIPV